MDPENPETKQCLNCQKNMSAEDKFCPSCGQKFSTGKISVFKLINEFVSDIFSLDSKVLRSIPLLLFQPGKLTVEFFKGKHKSFVSPIRLFLFTSLAYFAILTFYSADMINGDVKSQLSEQPRSKMQKSLATEQLVHELDSLYSKIKLEVPDTSFQNKLDSTLDHFRVMQSRDSIDISFFKIGDLDINIPISRKDLFTKSPEEIVEPIPFQGWLDRLIVIQMVKVAADGGNFVEFLFNRLSWLIFMMIPLFALVMKFLYIRRKKYYIEHLIFGLHFHSFLFIVGSLMMFLVPISVGVFLPIFSIYILTYLLLAMLKYYQQGIIKTLLKFGFLLFSFIFLITISIISLITLSVVMF